MGLVTRMWPAVAIAITGFWLWSAANWTDPNVPEGWQGVDLQIGSSQGRDARIQAHRDLIATVKARASGSIWNVDAESNGSGSGLCKTRIFPWSLAPPWSMRLDTTMCSSRSPITAAMSSIGSECRSRARCGNHGGRGWAQVAAPDRIFLPIQWRLWASGRATDPLRATRRLAGTAIDVRRPRSDRCSWKRMVDQGDNHRRNSARECRRMGEALCKTTCSSFNT